MKSIDLVCMKKLDQKVNIIPIIAKADTINKAELQKFKAKIMNELKSNGVSIYQFPLEDETVAEVNKDNNSHLPFAVVGSNEFIKVREIFNNEYNVIKIIFIRSATRTCVPGSIRGAWCRWRMRTTATSRGCGRC